MMIQNSKILCYGEVLWDMLPTGSKAGGAPMNVALHLHKIGAEVGLVAKVGDDNLGRELISFLKEFGLTTSMVHLDTQLPTSQVMVQLDENKNASYEICENVAWDNIQLTDTILNYARSAGVIVYGTLASRFNTSRKTLLFLLENSAALKVLDVNLRPPYDRKEIVEELLYTCDIAKVNEEELSLIASWHNIEGDDEELLRWLARQYRCETVCVTKGAQGADLFMLDMYVSHPGFKIELADSVGAGDAFLGGLVSSIISGKLPREAIAYASAVGAFVASKEGATPDYSPKEIEAILKQE